MGDPKNTANYISAGRILAALSLFLFLNNKPVFIAVYAVCGISDALDGYIARKKGIQSELGARLDSAADIVMFGVIIVVVLMNAGNLGALLIWTGVTAALRIAAIAYAWRKFRRFAALHTLGNKAAGLAVFITFPLFMLSGAPGWFIPALAIGTLSAIEEFAIHILGKSPNLNIRGIWALPRKRR